MVSQKNLVGKSGELSEAQAKNMAKEKLRKETGEYSVHEAKWIQPPTIFDDLPAHEKPFPIEPFPHERQRLPFKMSDEDRLRRKKFLQSQELTDREPVHVPELERMLYNPIRRFYRWPADKFFNYMGPIIGEQKAKVGRILIPKLLLGYVGACVLWYQFKYNKIVITIVASKF